MICNLMFVINVVLCQKCSKKSEIVGFSYRESVRKLLCFDILLGGFLLDFLATGQQYVQLDKQ